MQYLEQKLFSEHAKCTITYNFGWIKDENVWKQVWTPLPEAGREVAAKQDHVVPGNPAVKQLDLLYVTVVDTVKKIVILILHISEYNFADTTYQNSLLD